MDLEQKEKQAWAKLAFLGMTYPMSGALPGMSYDKGGPVKEDGFLTDKKGKAYAKVHKGEEVIPADKAKEMRAEKKKGKKQLAFSPKYDNDPRLKGGQSKLPDRVQKGILEKAAESRRNAALITAALLKAAE